MRKRQCQRETINSESVHACFFVFRIDRADRLTHETAAVLWCVHVFLEQTALAGVIKDLELVF